MKKIYLMIVCLALLMPTVLKAQFYSDADVMSLMIEEENTIFSTEMSSINNLPSLGSGITVNNGLTGLIIRPFENGNGNRNLEEANSGEVVFPGGDPTNQIPVGSGLCLVIGLALFIVTRVFYAFRHEVKNI